MQNRLLLLPAFLFLFFTSWNRSNAQNNNTLAISGPNVVCDCGFYSVYDITGYVFPSGTTYLWQVSTGDTVIQTFSGFYYCFPPSSQGVATTYTIKVSVGSLSTPTGMQSASIVVTVLPFSPLNITSSNTSLCNSDPAVDPNNPDAQTCDKVCPYSTVTYSVAVTPNPGGASNTLSWFVNGAQSYVVNPPLNNSVTVTWGAAGAGSVSVVSQGSSCSGEDALCVTVVEEPIARFATDPAPASGDTVRVCRGQTVWFDNQSLQADYFEWLFGDDNSVSASIDAQHTFSNPGVFPVRLIARSACLCADTATAYVEVIDAAAPALDCVGTVCPGATATYTAGGPCSDLSWSVSANGTVLAGGTAGADSITVQWNDGPAGLITLNAGSCTGGACPFPTVVRVPVVSDNAEIQGAERVCPDATEVYSIEPFGGTGFTWTLSGGGNITEGQGTNRVSIRWNSFFNPATTYWLSVVYDNCYLGCGGRDSIPVRIASTFYVDGPVERCAGASGNFVAKLRSNNQNLLCDWVLLAPGGDTSWISPAPTATPTVPFGAGPGVYRLLAFPDDPTLSCSNRAEWVVRVPEPPATPAGIDGPTLICPGAPVTYTASGVPPGGALEWTIQNGPGAPQIAGGNPVNVSWGPAGPYQVSVRQLSLDGLGCASVPAQLAVQPAANPAISGPSDVCLNANAVYEAPTLEGQVYQWSLTPADAGTIVGGQGTNSVEVFWQTAGNRTLSVSVCGFTSNFPVTVHPDPAPAVSHPAALCAGGTALVQTAAPYAAYVWQAASGNTLGTAASLTLGPGSYRVQVTDNAGCTGAAAFSINTAPEPNLTVSTTDPTAFCNNSQTVTMQALTPAGGGYTYQWFQNGAPVGTNSPVYATNQYGSYTVQATNAAGCTATAGPIALVQDCGGGGGGGFPGGGGPACTAGSINLQITPTAACDSFLFQAGGPGYLAGSASWIFGQSGAASIGNATGDAASFKFPNAGGYIVILFAQQSNGAICQLVDSLSVEAAARFDALPACPGAPSSFADLSTHLPSSSITGWSWNFGDPASGAANTSTAASPSHIFANAGAYTVSLTVTAASGCTAATTAPVDIPAGTPPAFALPAAACAGNALAFIRAADPRIVGVEWNFGDPASGAANTAAGDTVYHTFSAGAYTITATATDTFGCTAAASQTLVVGANTLSGNITPTAPGALCEGQTITLTAPAGGNYYLWSDSSATTTPTLTVSQEGLYSVTVTDANGCRLVPPPVLVDITPGPDALIKALLTNDLGQITGVEYPSLGACDGDDVRLIVQGAGAYSYTWSTGTPGSGVEFLEIRNNLLPVGTHIYTVTVTDAATGCTAVTEPFIVTINPVPGGFSIDNNLTPACAGSVNTLSYTGPVNANWQYVWNTGQTGVPLVTENPGLYYLRVINEFGCEAQSNNLTILPGPPVAAIPAGCHTRCRPDTLCLPPLPGITAWQWYYNGTPVPGATGPDFVAQQSGAYWAVLTDNQGCTAQSDPLNLNLYDGYGNVAGQVWSDVNNNGIIDGPDTLVSGIPVLLQQGGSPWSNGLSDTGGAFTFGNLPANLYTVGVDTALLPPGWQVVIGSDDALLAGCGGQAAAGLLLKPIVCTPAFGTLQLNACAGASVTFNGVTLAAGTTQDFLLTTPLGCDSTVTVTVTAIPPSASSLTIPVCVGEAAVYNGAVLSGGQTAQFTFQNSLGCDSVVTVTVTELPTLTSSFSVDICPGETYMYNGMPLTGGQTTNFTFPSTNGCDSIVTVVLNELPVSASSIEVAICPGASYDFNGTAIPAGQTASFTFQNYLGCDSVVTVEVTPLATSASNLNVAICPGETYIYDGIALFAGQTANFTFLNYLGCDSVVTVTVAELPVSASSLNVAVCPGETYLYNGTNLAAGQTANFTLQNYAGCDSVVTVTVSGLTASASSLEVGVCPGQTYIYNGVEIDPGTSAQVTLTNSVGCDSVVTVTVKALPTSAQSLTVSVCPDDEYDYYGFLLQPGEIREFNFTNYLGCDSVVTVALLPLPTATTPVNVTICPNETYNYLSEEILPGETRVFHLIGSEGCDSTVILTVSAWPETTFDLSTSPSCANGPTGLIEVENASGGPGPYRYSLDGSSFQFEPFFDELEADTYTVYLEDDNGCVFTQTAVLETRPPLGVALADAILPCDSNGVALAPLLSGDTSNLVFTWWNGARTPATLAATAGPVWVDVQNDCGTVRAEAAVRWAEFEAADLPVYVPNTVAPEADRIENSVFMPVFPGSVDVLRLRFEVYDRWGNLLFRTEQLNEGWSGVFRERVMDPAVYVWQLDADVAFCGRVLQLRRVGDVTVVR